MDQRQKKMIRNGSTRYQGLRILVSSEVSAQSVFPRTPWSEGVLEVVVRVDAWDVLGKAVWLEPEPRSVAEPYLATQSGDTARYTL